jgi:hypothetical protein
MGTDIQCWAERRTESGWEYCPAEDFYCGEERNYALFAILADVERFTNGGFEPIVPPRGLPPDSPVAEHRPEGAAGWEDGYGHNATWLTLEELLAFPWHERKRSCTGYVDAVQFLHYLLDGRPQQSLVPAGCPVPTRQIISNEEMERRINAGEETAGLLTEVSFEEFSYAEYAGPFLTDTLPLLSQQGKPADVRLVMFFDS